MMRGVRRVMVGLGLVASLCAGACKGAKIVHCAQSVTAYCASSTTGCVLTWEEAQSDTSFCSKFSPMTPPSRADCGGYHVVSVGVADAYGDYYYDAMTGNLVAIVVASGFSDSITCYAGPPTFTLPVCAGAGSEPLSQCADGGADAAVPDGGMD